MWYLESDDHDLLKDILQTGQLTALFQPIVDLSTAEIFGYEGLIRGPSNSPLHSPLSLLKAAAECGLQYKIERLCHQVLVQRFLELRLPGKLFLNISPDVLVQHSLQEGQSGMALVDSRLASTQIVMELTEGERIVDYGAEKLGNAVNRCCDEGFSVAIDDLGEGFSSLRLWSELRPAFVKVDRHFVQNIEHDPVKAQFVRSILEIARRAKCEVIAEGIETHSELMLVKSLGVALGQGYYFARPHANPSLVVQENVVRTIKSFMGQPVHGETSWGRDAIVARDVIHKISPVTTHQTNEEVFRLFEENPQVESIPVIKEGGVPVGLITRSALIGSFAQPYRHELFGKKSCTLYMDAKPLLVDKTATVQEISKVLGSAERRHLMQGFIVTDNGRYFGIAHGQDLIRVITEMQIQAAKYANPLTQLPGNVPIHEHLDGLLRARIPFAACYCDLDHFKPYNDVYGFTAGDSIIQMTANILAGVCDRDQDFLGHIGGDDFIILFQSRDWEARCQDALDEFGIAIRSCFSEEDLERGGYFTENRQYEREFHPLTSLSVGAVLVPPGLFSSYMEVSRLAAGAKKQAKRMAGNSLFVNRRYEPSREAGPLPSSLEVLR
ncbi:MAG: GGDEF domain-containing protein [Betaproteobacteria bacterium]|nr:GGDEF domain-containing protein [Betaproteobacteria bacterium]MDE2625394.1 GGDEF domain-containing protein [Betaproteobacteria bacterium]